MKKPASWYIVIALFVLSTLAVLSLFLYSSYLINLAVSGPESAAAAMRDLRLVNALMMLALAGVVISGICGFRLYRRQAQHSDSANVAKSQFLSRMSHEIRTPLNAIIGLTRMARETEDPEKISSYLENISDSSTHLLHLVNDVLDLSAIESGKIALDAAPVHTRTEIERICQMIRPQITAKGQQFTCHLEDNLPVSLYCDATHVRQVVMNILSNAVKFTPEGGQISLAVRLAEEKDDLCNIEFAVGDTGIGIDPEYLEHLFDPFEQGDGSATRKYGGTGLGLAISKQLVEMMGGEIRVESTPNRGSVFTFHFWLPRAPEDLVPEPPRRMAFVDLTGKTVLLVEDSDINQLIAGNLFAGMNARVEIAENGQAGLEMFRADPEKYDFIFMDIQMPVMDGYEATRQIRASGLPRAKTVPIVAMTANVFPADVEKALASGMNAHVGKPFEAEQVVEALQKVMA